MRVLIVCDYLGARNPSGAGRYALETGRALKALGKEVRILAGGGPEDPETDGSDGYPAVSRFPFPASAQRIRWLVGGGWTGIRRAFERTARAFSPTHLLLNQPLSGAAVLRASKGLPAFYIFHSPWGSELEAQGTGRLQRWPRDWVEQHVLARCRRVVTLSAYMEGELRHEHPDIDLPARVIPGGADLYRFAYRAPAEPHLVTVRRLVPRMGLENLLEAFSKCPSATLKIAGRGPLEGLLQERIVALGLSSRVTLEGYVPEEALPAFLGAASLFVLPSERLEGFGMVIAESMACGTPVLGTRVGAIPEVLGAFDPGLVTDRLAEGIAKLLDDPRRLAALRPLCRAHAERHFGWARAASDLTDWLERG